MPEIIPNWKRNGFGSKEDAMKYVIALTLKRVPSATIAWQNRVWSRETISKDEVKAAIELI